MLLKAFAATVKQITETGGSNPNAMDTVDGVGITCCSLPDPTKILSRTNLSKSNERSEHIYESAPIVAKYERNDVPLNNNITCCRDCRPTTKYQIDNPTVSKPCLRKLIRKSRSRKQKNTIEKCPMTRIRSLSVGNENTHRNHRVAHINGEDFAGDGSSGASGKDRNDECLNNLKRNDLIDIIRESMEKSRLCFQSNG